MGAAIELRPGSLLGGFRIDAPIGRGGMGVVYRATQLSLERQVALKLISPELAQEERFRERFLREARLAASLDHPHLLPVHEAGEAEGTLFLAMRLVEGPSLAELLRREGRLSPERALRLLAQVAEALEAAHAAGLMHRDVKPQNVLVAGGGEEEHAYLCDFGLSRRLSGGSLTGKRDFVGTAVYAAPEQIRGEPLDGGCDLYSLACLLYECLTGDPPFAREDELALLWAHLHEPPPVPSGVDPALARFDAFFSRALAKAPGERYPSASALAQAALAAPASEAAPAEGSRRPGPPARLPRPLTSFLGRERELQELLALLLDDGARFLTLTGPGGTGKTRLALRVAEEAADAFPDGVFWVGLASLRDFALVSETIAQTLGAKDSLPERIGERKLLLCLDNFEQVLAAGSDLAELLATCSNLSLLVTSREPLHLSGEHRYPLGPLAEDDAVALFSARARAVRPDFLPNGEVEAICSRLDQLPLAVELAAARVAMLTSEEILARLERRLSLLTGGPRDAPERQSTLVATIDWSYDLLDEDEKLLFGRLAVFAGSCSLEAVAAICEAELDTLTSLVDKSLIRPTEDGRFLMLETIREYAATLLGDAADAELRDRHTAYYRRWLEQYDTVELRCSNAVWSVLERDHPNLQGALEWAHTRTDDETALAICCALALFWMGHSHLSEGAGRLDRALQSADRAPADLRLAALDGRAILAHELGEFDREEQIAVEQRALSEREGDIAAQARALCNLALAYLGRGDFERAAELITESLGLARDCGDEWTIALSLLNAGAIELAREHYQEAVPLLEDSRRHGHASGASALFDPLLVFNLGLARLHMGAADEAAEFFRESISLALDVGSREYVAQGLYGFGAAALARNEPRLAAQLLGAGTAAQETLGFVFEPTEQALWEKTAAAAAALLGQEQFDKAWAEGAALRNNQAAVWALSLD